MAGENDPGRKIIDLEQVRKRRGALEQVEPQTFEDLLQGIDLDSPLYHAINHHIEFWYEYHQKGHNAFQSPESQALLAEKAIWDRNPTYQEAKFKIPEIIRNFVKELPGGLGGNTDMIPRDNQPIIIESLKTKKDQVIEGRKQQPKTPTGK